MITYSRAEWASRVRASVMCPTIKRPSTMIISSDLYRWVARESSREISTTGILLPALPATELPAAGCHVYAAAAQPRGDPDGQCSISSPSTMTPSREERVEQVMPVRDSRCLKRIPYLSVHDSRAAIFRYTDA